MCEDAGISADAKDMEQDFRVGGVIADLVDGLMTSMEAFGTFSTPEEGMAALEEEMEALKANIGSGADNAEVRKKALAVGVMAVRYAAEICHDETSNN